MSNVFRDLVNKKEGRVNARAFAAELNRSWPSQGSNGLVHENSVRNHLRRADHKSHTKRAVGDSTMRWICFALVHLKADAVQIELVLSEKDMPTIDQLRRRLCTPADHGNIWSWKGWNRVVHGSEAEMSLRLVGIDPKDRATTAIVLPTLQISQLAADAIRDIDVLHAEALHEPTARALLSSRVVAHSHHDVLLLHDLLGVFVRCGLESPMVLKDSSMMAQLPPDGNGIAFRDPEGLLHDIKHLVAIGLYTNKITRRIANPASPPFELHDHPEPNRRELTLDGHYRMTMPPENGTELGIIAQTALHGVSTTVIGGMTARGTARMGTFITQPNIWRNSYYPPTTTPNCVAVSAPGPGGRYRYDEYKITHQTGRPSDKEA